MDEVEVAKIATSTLRLCQVDNVLTATVRGVFTRASHGRARREIVQRLGEAPAGAVLVDLKHALCLMSTADRIRAVNEAVADSRPLLLPVALVVSDATFDQVTDQCAEAWGHGRLWIPFLDFDDALDWARAQGQARPRNRDRPDACASGTSPG